jgi:post-segregation antitoxin (ccd killing protein)
MTTKRATFTIDPQVLASARNHSDNLSATISELLSNFVRQSEQEQLRKALKDYEQEAKQRRAKHGLFSDQHRLFA